MALQNSQYNAILREYDSKQLRNKRELHFRTEDAYEQIPELKDLNQKIVALSMDYALRNISVDASQVNKELELLRQRNRELSHKKTTLLLKHGYPADYLTPHYSCPDCKDTGFVHNQKCHCFKQAIVNLVYAQSGLQSILDKENFSAFSLDYYSDYDIDSDLGISPRENAQIVLEKSNSFIQNFDSSYQNLLLYGNCGVGKTFLSNCIAKSLLDTGHTVIYLTAFEFFRILEKQAFQHGEIKESADSSLEYILDCDLLILDDLGTELNNTFTASRLYLCINERHLRQKSTLISTNLPLDALDASYSERIFSRLVSNYTLLKLVGKDIRLQKVLP